MPTPIVTEAEGQYRVERHPSGRLVVRLFARPQAAWFEVIKPELERAIIDGGGALTLFANVSRISDFDPAFRSAWVSWFASHRAKVKRAAICHNGSVLMKMALMAANVALGGKVERFDSSDQFEAELKKTLG